MKYIFDFDDVLFFNTAKLKPRIFSLLARAGVNEEAAKTYYVEVRDKQFILRDFIRELFSRQGISGIDPNEIYEEIMSTCPGFTNKEMIFFVGTLPRSDIFIVTNGGEEYNADKIKYSGIGVLFNEENIFIVPGTKKEVIKKICTDNPDETVVFIDDREHFMNDLDYENCPNLKTILYVGQDSLKLKEEIKVASTE